MMLPDSLRAGLLEYALRLLGLLPFRLNQFLGRCFGRCAWWCNARTARITVTNIALCLPQLSPDERRRLARRSLEHTGMTLFETPAIWAQPVTGILRQVRGVDGEALLDQAVAEGRGLLLLVPHLGNWELFNYWYGATRGGMTALYQPPRLAGLETFMRRARNRSGNQLVPTSRKGLAQLFRTLAAGGVVGILPDQVPASGHFAPFFGVAALSDVLATRLLRRTGARVLCGLARRHPAGGFEIVLLPADAALGTADLHASVAALNRSVEACVSLAPEQYQWEYKRFRLGPDGPRHLYRRRPPATGAGVS